MLGVMLQKLWHKKWMVVCLLLGIVLIVATVVSFRCTARQHMTVC